MRKLRKISLAPEKQERTWRGIKNSKCHKTTNVVRQFVQLNCRAITLVAGTVLRGEEASLEVFLETLWVRVIASQRSPRDSGVNLWPRGILMSPRALWAVCEETPHSENAEKAGIVAQ